MTRGADIYKAINDVNKRLNQIQGQINDLIAKGDKENFQQIEDTQNGLIEIYEASEVNSSDIEDLRAALEEVYELIGE